MGTTVEFSQRGTFLPLTDMIGDSPFGLAPGQWTGDTSMALCLLADRLRRHEAGGWPRDGDKRLPADGVGCRRTVAYWTCCRCRT